MGRARSSQAASTTARPRAAYLAHSKQRGSDDVKVVTHATLFASASHPPPPRTLPEGNFDPGVLALRAALGLSNEERLEVHLLLDRSGSVSADPGASSGQVALAEAFSGLDWSPTAVAVSGYDDDGTGTTIYEIKPFDLHHDRALYELPRIGGGGTPTGGAITKVTKDWRKYDYDRSLEAKLLVVVTDGTANDVVACRQAVDRALDSGIRVVAAFKATDNLEQEQEAMDAQFGRNWFAVEEYTDVPAALVRFLKRDGDIVDAASTPSPEVQEIGDSVLALSDSAARQFVAAHKSSSDFSLQLAALYVNVRLTDPDASPETALAAARGYQAGATLPANF